MLKRTRGIVLKTFPFAEADLIVTFLTSDFGLIRAFAKSPRKTKSRFGASLEPLTHSHVSLWGKEDAHLPRLTQSDIIDSFQKIRDTYASFMDASDALRFTLGLLPEAEPNRAAFALLLSALKLLAGAEGERERRAVVAVYKIRLLDISGYSPVLGKCSHCSKEGYGIFDHKGNLTCYACEKARHTGKESPSPRFVRLSPGCIKLYESLRAWDLGSINRIKPSDGMLREIAGLLEAHMECVGHRG